MSEGHPKDIKSNWKGVNHNTEREISGSGDSGEYLEGKNGRVTSTRGNNMSFEKIRGEEELHSNVDAGVWYCLGSISVKDQLFEIWVDETNSQDPVITVDGVKVAKSPDLPFLFEFPVQMDKNDNCLGGEAFITDNNTPPLIFDVKDMVDSLISDPTKYFADFNLSLYTINLDAPLDIPIFKELVSVGSGGGLPVGQYQYAIRYVNDDGDRTNFGPLTPPIPVVRLLSTASAQYPNVKTYGDEADVTSETSYGIKLRFRVTNLFNYDFVEIKRLSYSSNSGVDFVPVGQIVAKIDVSAGEISIKEFIDPTQSNVVDTLADDEELNDLSTIQKAKAIRYHDKRLVLMNIERASKTTDGVTFDLLNGEKIFPILEHIGKDGHNDPVKAAYKRNYTSGERFSFAASFFDGSGGRGFAVDDLALRNFQIPNRRDPLSSVNSLAWSTSQLPSAANVDSDVVIGKTFEAFDLHDPVSKSDKCSFINITSDSGSLGDENPLVASKGDGEVNSEGCPDAGYGSVVQASEIGYEPFTPVSNSDATAGHNYRVNLHVEKGSGEEDYEPLGFSPNYYSKGIAISGISNIPEWAKSFTVARTRPAGRVICQGIGMYAMTEGSGFSSGPSKDANKLWFYSPDIDSGLVGSGLIDDIQANPSEYSIQLISPLGFFSEVYGFDEEDTPFSRKDKIVDMIAYARILEDSGQINPTESGVGISDHVAYNKYRNSDVAGAGAFSGIDGGNTQIPLSGTGITVETNDRGIFYTLETASNVYQHGTVGGTSQNNFENPGLKDWTEPYYIVNIIQDGKTVVDQNIDGYGSTGHYQKVESIIGLSNGNPGQSLQLVDERWQDCIPDLSSGGALAATEIFVYVRNAQGTDDPWMDVTFLTPAQITAIEFDITTNGFYLAAGGVEVVGLYTHTNSSNEEFSIDFNVTGHTPATAEQIIVKYDSRRPLIVFGGDSSIGESIFSPIDLNITDKNDEASQFEMNVGFPFLDYRLNPRHYIINKITGNQIQDNTLCRLGYIRQLAVMFTCETRSSINFAHNVNSFDQFFPLTHYIMRPNKWKDGEFENGIPNDIADDNKLFQEYFDDYPFEWTQWVYGGIRYKQNINLDYAVKGPIEYFSKPDFGFEEKNKYCTAVVWSLSRDINQQDSPGLKTFLALNQFDISDDDGEIKKAWDAISGGKGENLYAICDSGICLLLTKKAILSNLNGTDLTTLATDSFISGEYWLSHDVGLNDEMWRGAAEGSIEIATESGMIKVPGIYIPNKESVYRLYENQIKDIVKHQNYFDVISPYLKSLNTGYDRRVTGSYNSIYNEYWLQLNSTIGTETFTFAQNKDKWQGRFSYRFDQYIQLGDKLLGSRDLKTFELDKGFVINGTDIEMYLIQNTTPGRGVEMEFIRIQVDSDNKPTKVEFLDEDYNVLCKLDQASKGPLYLKDYNGWEQFIPRKNVGVSVNRERIQSRLLIYKIFHNLAEDFRVIESIVQYKKIK